MKVLPDQPHELVIKLRGDDSGARTFDVLASEKIIGTPANTKQSGGIYDVVLPLPLELTKGKQSVTVKFAAHPGKVAGGIYGLQVRRVK